MQTTLSYIVPLAVIGIFWMRFRGGREVRVTTARLVGSAVVISALIAIVYASEHHTGLDESHLWISGIAAVTGLASGIARSRAFELRLEGDSVLMNASRFGFFLLLGIVLIRAIIRQIFGAQSALVLDASLIFVLFMVVSQRFAVWRRAQNLLRSRRVLLAVGTQRK